MGCEGESIKYEDIMPKELQALRKKIAAYTSGRMGQTATALPEGFPISAQVNPLQTNAANIMNMLMGGGAMGGGGGYNTAPRGYGGGAATGGYSNPTAAIQAAMAQGGRGVLPGPGQPTLPQAPIVPPPPTGREILEMTRRPGMLPPPTGRYG